MWKLLLGLMLVLGLSGCEHTHSWAQSFSFLRTTPTDSAEAFDFNWRLSGAREVAPMQIFSANKQLWLQFDEGQKIPAIFAIDQGKQIPLSYKRSEPYVVVQGNWQELLFQGASLQAKAHYQAPKLAKTEPTPEPAQSFALDIDSHTVKYAVAPDDLTMRQALKRWAKREGWVFDDQHWEVEVDLPIVSTAAFSADFSDAVSQLMRSTALSTKPLQACLYSNKVMRVIPLAQDCDPTTTDRLQG